MNSKRTTRTLGLVAAGVTALLVLTGCGDGTSYDTAAMPPDAMTSEVMPGEPAMAEGAMTASADKAVPAPTREIIRTGYLAMRVKSVPESVAKVRSLIAASGGIVASEDASAGGDDRAIDYANITAQIPADTLDSFIADVSALGNVDSVNVSAQDVTQQGVDLDARIAALRTSVERMNELLVEAERIEDLLAIETQLSARQAELDSLVAQRTWLSQQVAMSTITVSMSPITTISDVEVPGFLSGLESGWSALVTLTGVAITALGFAVPFILIGLVLAGAVLIVLLLIRRARKSKSV